jgi:4-hydroxy-3-methylbut-2-enyl diphosphate reductase
VKCIKSYGGERARIISGPGDADDLKGLQRPFLLSQTTQNTENYRKTRDRLLEEYPGLEDECTICNSTGLRQGELRRLCPRVDCVVVVGGRNSANTARLVEIAGEEGLPVFHVETYKDLNADALSRYENVLLTAGASTPSWSIRKVRERLLEIQGGTLRTGRFRKWLQNMIFGNFHVLPVTLVLGTAGAHSLGINDWRVPVLVSSLFLFGVHAMTSALESGFSRPSGLRRQEYLRSHRRMLIVAALVAFLSSVLISVFLKPIWTVLLILMLLAFLLYSMPLIRKTNLFRGLRALPGSRDLMFAGAWSFLLGFLPGYVSSGMVIGAGTILWSAMLFFLFLGRCLLADLVDLQGDALMGMDTIPIHAGRKRSVKMFWICIIASLLITVIGSTSGFLHSAAITFLAGPFFLAAGYILLARVPFPSELAKRLMADGSLFMAGFIPLLLIITGGHVA